MNRITTTLAALLCASTLVSSAHAGEIEREALFIMGMPDAEVRTELEENHRFSGYGFDGLSYLWVRDWPLVRAPINGTVDLKQLKHDRSVYPQIMPTVFYALPTATDPRVSLPYFNGDKDDVKVLTLTIRDSEVVGFEVDIQIDRDTTGDCALGFHSIKGNQDGIEVVYKEQHEENGPCLNRDWEPAPFGKAVKYYNYLCDQEFLDEFNMAGKFNLTDKDRLGCYWMENVTGNYCWVAAPQGDIDLQACKKLDSCNGGGNASGGGCYKYAVSSMAPRKAWPEE